MGAMLRDRKVSFVGFAALCVMVAIVVLHYRTLRQQVLTTEWVDRTYKVLAELERVPASIADAENARRSFALSKDPAFLDDFDPAIRRAQLAMDAARSLLHDETRQRGRIDALRP